MEGETKSPERTPTPRAALARTLANYRGIEASAPENLQQNPGKTLAETMDDEALRLYMHDAIEALVSMQEIVESGGEDNRPYLEKALRERVAPDMEYLRSIGRLPAEFDFDIYKRFHVPRKSS